MRYPGSEKLEIIRLVEQSHLPVRRTLEHLGIPSATFYRWYERFQTGGPEALEDRPSRPDRVWNRIPDEVRGRILDLALTELWRDRVRPYASLLMPETIAGSSRSTPGAAMSAVVSPKLEKEASWSLLSVADTQMMFGALYLQG